MPAVIMIGGKGLKPEKDKGATDMGDDTEGGDEQPSSRLEARKEASRAIIRAVKMGDPEALDTALEAHYEACEGGGGGGDGAEV